MQAIETPAKISFSPLGRRYNLEEFWALPDPKDRSHYDLIGGYLFMVPPPEPPHGIIDARLARLLFKYLDEHDVGGKVYHPREPIYRIASNTYLEPDMMYISSELGKQMGSKRTSADIVFEYLSPGTTVYDRTTKADTYLELGVRELWLVDPITVTIEVRNAVEREDGLTWESLCYSTDEWAESRVLDGWRVSVDEILKEDED